MPERFKGAPEQPRNKLEILKEKGIVSFEVKLTAKEKKAVEKIEIEKELPQLNYYGPADEALVEELHAYLGQLEGNSEEVISAVSGLIARVAHGMQKDFKKGSCWTMVRVSLPNADFDIPRWHQDGNYVKPAGGIVAYKLVFTVKGARSRFAEIAEAEKYKELEGEASKNYTDYRFHNGNQKEYEKKGREIREKLLPTVTETKPIDENQAVIYRVGDDEAKVHSEPPMDAPRIFMSVVTGSPEEIQEFKKRWER
ncbi:MAG: hypothetical protein WA001_02940 [Patescibacteria group bacterium]